MNLTQTQAQQITGDGERWHSALNNALDRWDINTPERAAMFLAQCAHESGGFKHLVENLKYSANALLRTWPNRFTPEDAVRMAYDERQIAERAYGGRMGNGPEGGGDGYRYRGRGIIQLTGRDNYDRCSKAFRVDFIAEPDLLERPEWAALSAGWFWATRGCNALADAGDFTAITQRINGGQNGAEDREHWLATVRAILNAPAIRPKPIEVKTQPKEAPMPAPLIPIAISVLQGLIPQVLGLFSQRAEATITEKTGADPKLATQFMQGLIQKVGETVGVPVVDQATAQLAAAQLVVNSKTPEGAAQVRALEADTLDYLHDLTQAMREVVDIHSAEVKVSDASADAASVRAERDRAGEADMARPLVYGALGLIASLVLFTFGVAIAQIVLRQEASPTTEVWAAITGLIGFATGVVTTLYAYRFGTSKGSGAKDILIGEMARRDAIKGA
jgi:putative chitinase